MINRIVSLIEVRFSNRLDHPAIQLKQLIFDVLSPLEGQPRALELSESKLSRVKSRLAEIYAENTEQGHDCWFDFNSASDDVIQGPCFIEPRDTSAVQAAKLNRLKAAQMKAVLEQITFTDFEVICAALLHLLGARNFKKTAHSRDQGIDFYGRLVLGDLVAKDYPFFRFEDHLLIWLVGQAKHYVRGQVGAPEIRNLVGAVNLARFKEYASTTELLAGLKLRSCDPVFALFMTTGTFSRDARRLAANSGVITKDVEEIAKFLVDKTVGLDPTGQPNLPDLKAWATATYRQHAGI